MINEKQLLKTGRDIHVKIEEIASIEAELFGPFSVELVEALRSIATKKPKIWILVCIVPSTSRKLKSL